MRRRAGLVRYDVTACPTKLIPGTYGFVAQCNEGRASKKRPTEFRIDQASTQAGGGGGPRRGGGRRGGSAAGCVGAPLAERSSNDVHRSHGIPSPPPLLALQVAQPFDAGKFNFTKALQKEVLLMFEPSAPSRHHRAANKPSFSPAVSGRLGGPGWWEKRAAPTGRRRCS